MHCYNILNNSPSSIATLRFPPGDTDINKLTVSMLYDFRHRVIIDDGCGKYRKVLTLNPIVIDEEIRDALIGLHAFTRNDYVSSFLEKTKKTATVSSVKAPDSKKHSLISD